MYTENIYMNAHISIIHNRQTWKQAQKFINQWMNKQNEVYLNKNLSATKSNELLMWSMQQHEWIWKTLKNKRNWIQKSEYCMILLIFKNRQNSPLVIEIRTPESMQGGDWFNFLGPWKDFPVAQVIKESACNAEDQGSIPGLGRSSGKGNDNSLQYSCLENSMDREAWQATVHGVSNSQTQLSN